MQYYIILFDLANPKTIIGIYLCFISTLAYVPIKKGMEMLNLRFFLLYLQPELKQ